MEPGLKFVLPTGLLALTMIAAGACSSDGGSDETQPVGGGGVGAAGGASATGGNVGGDGAATSGGGTGATTSGGGAGTGGDGPTPSSGCGATSWTDGGGVTIDVNGTDRYYRITLPDSYDSSTPYQLVFVWHGQGGAADTIADGYGGGYFKYSGLLDLANDGAIFVAGPGLGKPSGWPDNNGEDIDFAEAILSSVTAEYCVDQERIFSTGMSYGGIMSNRVGCEMGDDVRAIAPIMGSGPINAWSNPPGSGNCITYGTPTCVGQVAAWITHGRNDDVVDFCLGELTRDYWQSDNSCSTTGTANGVGECVEYDGCDPGYPVVWCPSDEDHSPPPYHAAEIWAFFSRF